MPVAGSDPVAGHGTALPQQDPRLHTGAS